MAKYSTQAVDKVSKVLSDRRHRTIDGDTETMIIDALLERKYIDWPAHWKSQKFSPCTNLQHAYELLDELHPSADFYIDRTGKTGIYESYVVDPGHAVFGFEMPRTIVSALWNHYALERVKAELDA